MRPQYIGPPPAAEPWSIWRHAGFLLLIVALGLGLAWVMGAWGA